jgi:hypothetical protein
MCRKKFFTFSLAILDNEWIILLLETTSILSWTLSLLTRFTQIWCNEIDNNNTCNNNCCLREEMILHWMNTKQQLHPLAIETYGCLHSCFASFLITCAQTIIMNHHVSSLVPLMLISHYWQCVSIALQCAQAITILQCAITLGWCSSFFPHIIINALSSLIDFSRQQLSHFGFFLSLLVIIL